MIFGKQQTGKGKHNYRLYIEVESREDEKDLLNTLEYLIAKKNKSHYEAKAKLLPLPLLLKDKLSG